MARDPLQTYGERARMSTASPPPAEAQEVDVKRPGPTVTDAMLRSANCTHLITGYLVVTTAFRVVDLSTGTEVQVIPLEARNDGRPLTVPATEEGLARLWEALGTIQDGLRAELETSREKVRATYDAEKAPRRGD